MFFFIICSKRANQPPVNLVTSSDPMKVFNWGDQFRNVNKDDGVHANVDKGRE